VKDVGKLQIIEYVTNTNGMWRTFKCWSQSQKRMRYLESFWLSTIKWWNWFGKYDNLKLDSWGSQGRSEESCCGILAIESPLQLV